jgi:hypothetical protein
MKNYLLLIATVISFNLGSKAYTLNSAIDRLLEIRYIVMEIKDSDTIPSTIKISNKDYQLFRTKEEAYNAILNSTAKSDVAIVYVISKEEKESERFTLPK